MRDVDVASGKEEELIDNNIALTGCAYTVDGRVAAWSATCFYLTRTDGTGFKQLTVGVASECAVVLDGRVVVLRLEHNEWKTICLAIDDTALHLIARLRTDLAGVYEQDGRVFAKNGWEMLNLDAACARALTADRPAFGDSDLDDDDDGDDEDEDA